MKDKNNSLIFEQKELRKVESIEVFYSSILDLEIDGVLDLIVKFGPEYNDEHDEILILPHEVYEMNVAQYIYELIVLSVPSKRIRADSLSISIVSIAWTIENFNTSYVFIAIKIILTFN